MQIPSQFSRPIFFGAGHEHLTARVVRPLLAVHERHVEELALRGAHAGVLARVEEDTNGDGKVDKWETWRDGAVAMVAGS